MLIPASLKKTRNEQELLQAKPQSLGHVEKPLREPTPRQVKWLYVDSDPRVLRILNEWLAIRGWVVISQEYPDNEGPDFFILYAYELEGQLHQGTLEVGYDVLHWVISTPLHREWFHEKMHSGIPLTILVDPADHTKSMIFGQTEAFVEIGGQPHWAAE
jgi:hypothetical protein